MYGIYKSELGLILIKSDGEAVTGLDFVDGAGASAINYDCAQKCAVIEQCKDELTQYFKNGLEKFEVKISYQGTDFRRKVWDKLLEIPYGETISYKELAERIGNVKAVRAVGRANHHNPISIIVPCHRVIGSDNSLTGYGGGLWRKEWLIRHEKRCEKNNPFINVEEML